MNEYLRALETIYSQFRRQFFVCALAVTRCPELAEDAVHDAFCKLAARRIEAENLKAYVFRAVRNAAIDGARRRGRPAGELDGSIFDPAPGPAAQVGEAEFKARAARALDALRPEERETIVQHLWGDLTFREIAEVCDAPLGTVVSWYRRGIERMREELNEQ
jgi:RNA polymerase sigma-70 factor (ECF subfamily)